MLVVLLLVLHCLAIQSCAGKRTEEIDECFNEAEDSYISCDAVEGRPSKCDCGDRTECYIRFVITRTIRINDDKHKYDYHVNGELGVGPMIIAKPKTLMIVDVLNYMGEDTSIHWHGMHQKTFPWMDGVGNITQYPTRAFARRFRHIFRAYPQGTHWYHSHMRFQRETGLFGVLVVHDELPLKDVVDTPEEYTMVLQDLPKPAQKNSKGEFCLPDGTRVPTQFSAISILINGKSLSRKLSEKTKDAALEFLVVPGRKYRFRVLGAMGGNILMMGVEQHKMHVVATDGFRVRNFTTDYLVLHVSERYDFVVEAKEGVRAGKKYPIRVQTLATRCSDTKDTPAALEYAYLVYNESDAATRNRRFYRGDYGWDKFTVLNCPMKNLPDGYFGSGTTTECHDVTSLQLQDPTPSGKVPSNNPDKTIFLDFLKVHSHDGKPFHGLVNGVHFEMPLKPLVDNTKMATKGCHYPLKCEEEGETQCTHAVYFGDNQSEGYTIRFVLSTLADGETFGAYQTHPIHMHGHSFFVAKIGYPVYNHKDKGIERNPDVTVPKCGAGDWTDGPPEDILVNPTTVRKDAVIVPAGGYAVVDIIADNPGYWFMHCHIDFHLNKGMAVALGENIPCARDPPKYFFDNEDFCMTPDEFLKMEGEKPKCKKEEPEKEQEIFRYSSGSLRKDFFKQTKSKNGNNEKEAKKLSFKWKDIFHHYFG